MTAPDQTNAEVSDERLRELEAWAVLVSTFPPKEGHPSPAMYAEIASAFTELLTRRSVTSQASEGAAEPVLAPNGLSAEQRAVWDAIDVRMQSAPVSGIGATGEFSGALQKQQFTFKQGLAVARLAALNALAPSQPAAVAVTDEMVGRAVDALRDLEIKYAPPDGVSIRQATIAEAQRLVRAALRSTP